MRWRPVLLPTLAVLLMALTALVGAGHLTSLDYRVSALFARIWVPGLQPVAKGAALLGGMEVTFGLAAILFLFLRQAGYRNQSWAVLSLPLVVVLEVLYKQLVFHPGPPASIAHGDGPSLFDVLEGSGVHNSFPSGHLSRGIVLYGLAGFVLYRLIESRARAWLAVGLCAFAVLATAFTRLYLEVHWLSDVLGAVLLGGICLTAATVWLDRAPRLEKNR